MLKRIFDVLLSSIALLIFLPFAIPIVLVLRFTGEGEIFYLQKRIGYRGEPFFLFKFATMLKDSPKLGTGDITVQNDPRVLPAGKFLRKTKLNEVPQILNIIKGDMSIVGPRPLTTKNFNFYSDEEKKIISSMRPGLTGIGSIVFRDEESIISTSDKPVDQCYREEIAPRKARLEQWYYNHRNFFTDLLIIFVTAWVVINSNSKIYYKIWKDLPII